MPLLEDIQSLDDLELENQVVFLRADLDFALFKGAAPPFTENLRGAAKTVTLLQSRGARVVLGSRFGEKKAPQEKKEDAPSIEPAAQKLSEYLDCDILLPDACVGDSVKRVLQELTPSKLCILENLASDDDQGPGSEAFARKLATFVDVYVGDSLRVLSTPSATTTQLPRLLEFRAAGPCLMKELSAIERINSGIDGPRVVIWGGSRLSTRLDVLSRLAESASYVVLVGVAANTMLAAQGGALGRSVVEETYLAGARTLADKYEKKLVLPTDFVCAPSVKAESGSVHPATRVPKDLAALDLGPETRHRVETLVRESGTAIWCGTAGFHKAAPFAEGTRSICRALAASAGFTMVAGEDSVAAAHAAAPESVSEIDCVAFGGAATLSLLSDNKLVGLEALRGIIHEQPNSPDRR